MGREPIQHCFNVSKDDINWKELAFNRTNGAITQAEVDGLKESYFTPCATQHLWSWPQAREQFEKETEIDSKSPDKYPHPNKLGINDTGMNDTLKNNFGYMMKTSARAENNRKKKINTVDLCEAMRVKMKQIIPKPWEGHQTTRKINEEIKNICNIFSWNLLSHTPASVKLQFHTRRDLHELPVKLLNWLTTIHTN